MTYPPQPGGQPGPYGQQGHPGGWQPPTGQSPLPQGGQGYGPPQGYGQPYGGMPPHHPGQPMPPAPKRKTGLWVGISVAVVALAAFGVTGFVAPGFLLDDEESDSDGSTGVVEFGDSEAATAAEQFAQSWADSDSEAIKKMICPGEEAALTGYAVDAAHVTRFQPSSELTEQQNPPSASFRAKLSLENRGEHLDVEAEFTLAKPSGSWCWAAIEEA